MLHDKYQNMLTHFLCVLALFSTCVFSASLPPDLPLCHRKDPDFQNCVAKNMAIGIKKFKDGYKDLGLPSLDPVFIPQLEIGGEPGKAVTLQQKYNNMYTYGISDTVFRDFKLEIEGDSCGWSFNAFTPTIKLESEYELKGQLLVFPINGHGKCNVTMYELNNKHQMKCEKYEKKGKTHIKIIDYKMDMKPKSVVYYFEDVVPGNAQVSSELMKTINENGLQIFTDVKHGFEKVWAELHIATANQVFSKIPLNEMFLE